MGPHLDRQFMKHSVVSLALLSVMMLVLFPYTAYSQLMVIGNDEKVTWDDAGKLVTMAPGKDSVVVVDIGTNPEAPK